MPSGKGLNRQRIITKKCDAPFDENFASRVSCCRKRQERSQRKQNGNCVLNKNYSVDFFVRK